MVDIIGYILILMSIGVALFMLIDAARGRSYLISTRNFFLLGLIIFQLNSGAFALLVTTGQDAAPTDLSSSAPKYLVMITIFLAIFLSVTNLRRFHGTLVRLVPIARARPSATSLLTFAALFLLIGLSGKYAFASVPVLGPLGKNFGNGLIGLTVAMCAWAYAPRLLNPAIAIPAGVMIGVALLSNLGFGRRGLLSIAAAGLWGAYYGHWKNLGLPRSIMWIGVAGVIGITPVLALTAVRSGGDRDISKMQIVQRMLQADAAGLSKGLIDFAAGQNAGSNSLWCIENYPDNFDYYPLHSLRYAFAQPIPRAIFPAKPDALGRRMVDQSGVQYRDTNFSLGPGLAGHMAADNAWIAVPIYAVLLGMMFGFLDELAMRHPHNPFVVLPLGIVLGQVIGMPRGELGLFTAKTIAGILAAWVATYLAVKILAMFGHSVMDEGELEYVDYEWVEDEAEYDALPGALEEEDPDLAHPAGDDDGDESRHYV